MRQLSGQVALRHKPLTRRGRSGRGGDKLRARSGSRAREKCENIDTERVNSARRLGSGVQRREGGEGRKSSKEPNAEPIREILEEREARIRGKRMTEPKEEATTRTTTPDTRTMEEGRKQRKRKTALGKEGVPRISFLSTHTRTRTSDKELLDTLSILEEEEKRGARGGCLAEVVSCQTPM